MELIRDSLNNFFNDTDTNTKITLWLKNIERGQTYEIPLANYQGEFEKRVVRFKTIKQIKGKIILYIEFL